MAFSPDAKSLVSGYGETVKLWDVATWRERASLNGHSREVASLAFSPDGKTLATGCWDGSVKLWDFATARERTTLKLPKGTVNTVAFSPDGKTLAAGTGKFGTPGEVVLWDIATGDVKSILRGHKSQISGVAFAPDGRTLATSGSDTTVRIWDLASGKILTTFPGRVVAFSPDGKTLALSSSSGEGIVELRDVAKALKQNPAQDGFGSWTGATMICTRVPFRNVAAIAILHQRQGTGLFISAIQALACGNYHFLFG